MTDLTSMWKFQNSTNRNMRKTQYEPKNIVSLMFKSEGVRSTGQRAPKIQRVQLATQGGQSRDYDQTIYDKEYAIERENIDTENETLSGNKGPILLNLAYKLSAPVKQTLIKKLNDIIKEAQTVFSGEVSALKFLEIFKAFNELSFSYNEYISDIIKDSGFKMLFHSKLINLESIFVKINQLLENIASGKFTSEDLKIKTSGNYNGDYISMLITQIISVINLMLLDKDTTQYLQDKGMTDVQIGQLSTEPQDEVKTDEGDINDEDMQRKKAEEELSRLERNLQESSDLYGAFDENDSGIGQESKDFALAKMKQAQYERDVAFIKKKIQDRKDAEEKQAEDDASAQAEIERKALEDAQTEEAKQKALQETIDALGVEIGDLNAKIARWNSDISTITGIPEDDRTIRQKNQLVVLLRKVAEAESEVRDKSEELARLMRGEEGDEEERKTEEADIERRIAEINAEMPAIRASIARLNAITIDLRTTDENEELKTAKRELKTRGRTLESLNRRLEELRSSGGIEESKDEEEYQDPGESEDKFVYDAKLLYKNISEDAYYKFLRVNIAPFMYKVLKKKTKDNIENGTDKRLTDSRLKSVVKGTKTPWYSDYVKYAKTSKKPFNPITTDIIDAIYKSYSTSITRDNFVSVATKALITDYEGSF